MAHKVACQIYTIDPVSVERFYNRTESMAPGRQISSFECSVCSVTMESWNTTWVPSRKGRRTKPLRPPQLEALSRESPALVPGDRKYTHLEGNRILR